METESNKTDAEEAEFREIYSQSLRGKKFTIVILGIMVWMRRGFKLINKQ